MSVQNIPPRRTMWAERVAYSNGMLLDEADFETEQFYHRDRLSMLARYLHGTGTVCGLNVEIDEGDPRRVEISPGLGIDRAGRIIQSPLHLCLNIDNWYADQIDTDEASGGGAAAKRAFKTGVDGNPDHVLADVFLGFRECETAKRPSFENGQFDALGALSPLRLRDAVEATIVFREEPTPNVPAPDVPAVSGASFAARRRKLDEAKRTNGWREDIWWDGNDNAILRDKEHPNDALAADIFLARLRIPATDGTPPELVTSIALDIDNSERRMVYSTADLIALGK